MLCVYWRFEFERGEENDGIMRYFLCSVLQFACATNFPPVDTINHSGGKFQWNKSGYAQAYVIHIYSTLLRHNDNERISKCMSMRIARVVAAKGWPAEQRAVVKHV